MFKRLNKSIKIWDKYKNLPKLEIYFKNHIRIHIRMILTIPK